MKDSAPWLNETLKEPQRWHATVQADLTLSRIDQGSFWSAGLADRKDLCVLRTSKRYWLMSVVTVSDFILADG